MVHSIRHRRFATAPVVVRHPNAPQIPGGIITLVEDYKGRNVVSFSTVPVAPKRTRGPNKPRRDFVPTGKLKSPPSTKETARRTKISKTMLRKRGPDVKKAMTPAERKRNQRKNQTEEEKIVKRKKEALNLRVKRNKKQAGEKS